jgi:hypothetical protein
LIRKPQKKADHLEDLGGDGRLIWILLLEEWGLREWIGLLWLRIGPVVAFNSLMYLALR